MKKEPKQTSCPNCNAVWGTDEIDYQQCDKCGYPVKDDNQEEKGYYEGDFGDVDDRSMW